MGMRMVRVSPRSICALALVGELCGCAMGYKKDEAATKQPVNCATAQGDPRALKGE